jgi:hypothetical protein
MGTQFTLDSKLKFYESPYKSTTTIRNFVPVKLSSSFSFLNKADYYHQGLCGYFQQCWGDHAGIVISPDILWQLFFSEFVKLVTDNVEEYRSCFTTSKDKKTILVAGPCSVGKFISSLVEGVREASPFDVTNITPMFSTSTKFSFLTNCALTLEAASQYYDYCMYCCGFPSITINGSKEDWEKLIDSFHYVVDLTEKSNIQEHINWSLDATNLLSQELINNLENQEFWSKMYIAERCGSGSDYEVSGWIRKLIFGNPDKKMLSKNFPHAIATVKYKNLMNGCDYSIYSGIIGSNKLDQEDGTTIFEPVHGVVITGDDIENCGCLDAVVYQEPITANKGAQRMFPKKETVKEENNLFSEKVRNAITTVSKESTDFKPIPLNSVVYEAVGIFVDLSPNQDIWQKLIFNKSKLELFINNASYSIPENNERVA